MEASIFFSVLCAVAWGTQSVFLKKAMTDIPLSAAILISLVANFLALILMIGVDGGEGFGAFFDIPPLVFFYFVLAGLFNDPLGRAPLLSSPLAFPKPH